MTEKALKIVPEAKKTAEAPAQAETKPAGRFDRKRLRTVLLIVVPLLLAIGGGAFYMLGGRYISTDNAYVGAQKVLITPDISGKVLDIKVREGQHVKAGDELFALDPEPFKSALVQAQAKLADARVSYDNLKTNLASLSRVEVDYLKIDQPLVRKLPGDTRKHAICEAIVAMSHRLGIGVIAEGIETEEELARVRDIGCDFAQGYLYARPLDVQGATQWIVEDRAHPAPGDPGS